MMSTGWVRLAAGLALGALALALPAQAADKVRIGMTVSSTGSFALASQSGVRGVEIWVDDVNKRGGIEVGGKKLPVELVKLDDRSDKQMVTRVYENLIADEKVDFVFAPFGSTLTAAAATVSERHGKYMMVWSAASNDLYRQGFKYMVSGTQMPVSVILKASIELARELGIKKVAILHSDEPYPTGEAEGGRDLLKAAGMDIVLYEKYTKGQKDFSTLLQKVRASGAEALFPAAYEGDQISILRQMKQLNISFPFVFMEYAAMPQFTSAVGKDIAYVYSRTNYHPAINWPVTAGFNRQQFADAYKAKFPKVEFEPDYQTILAYGAGVLAEEIIKRAGSTDAAAMKKASLELSDKVTVLAGPYAIDETGLQLKMPFPILQAQADGRLETVWPKEVATAKPVYPAPAWNKR